MATSKFCSAGRRYARRLARVTDPIDSPLRRLDEQVAYRQGVPRRSVPAFVQCANDEWLAASIRMSLERGRVAIGARQSPVDEREWLFRWNGVSYTTDNAAIERLGDRLFDVLDARGRARLNAGKMRPGDLASPELRRLVHDWIESDSYIVRRR